MADLSPGLRTHFVAWCTPSSKGTTWYESQATLVSGAIQVVTCNCPGWVIKRKNMPRECVHTKEFIRSLEKDGLARTIETFAQRRRPGAMPMLAAKATTENKTRDIELEEN